VELSIREGAGHGKREQKNNMKPLAPSRRTAERCQAGQIALKGPFFRIHRQEIHNLISNIERREKGERPLERIMGVTDDDSQMIITTTGVHIARRIGEGLSRSYNGELSYQYGEGEKSIRVYWQR